MSIKLTNKAAQELGHAVAALVAAACPAAAPGPVGPAIGTIPAKRPARAKAQQDKINFLKSKNDKEREHFLEKEPYLRDLWLEHENEVEGGSK